MGAHRTPLQGGGHSRGYVRGEVAPLTDCVPRRLPRVHRVPPGNAPPPPHIPYHPKLQSSLTPAQAPRLLWGPARRPPGRVAGWQGRPVPHPHRAVRTPRAQARQRGPPRRVHACMARAPVKSAAAASICLSA